ncbi:hypothetical protein EV385_0480 [Krasilnikovia cinnamomea]|uniref:HEAT repeat protein n=1 Tax=Krasilnikovia cinnamomea TaxID=349313 RepID=A0A4V2G6H6_9ACTN|nr:hypothetical protein EV385_0480 [Krasilnikovia cinnamomea]
MDVVVHSLLLDPRDTAVTDATAEGLLLRADGPALRLFTSAWTTGDDEHSQHLYDALSGRLFTLSCGSQADRSRFRRALRELLVDADVAVRDGAQEILAYLVRALPD